MPRRRLSLIKKKMHKDIIEIIDKGLLPYTDNNKKAKLNAKYTSVQDALSNVYGWGVLSQQDRDKIRIYYRQWDLQSSLGEFDYPAEGIFEQTSSGDYRYTPIQEHQTECI